MPDTLSLGDTGTWGAKFTRNTTKGPIRKVPLQLATLALTITDPAGTDTTYAIGAFRNPEKGVYELDRTHAVAGTWTGVITATAAYTDEHSVSRSATITRTMEVLVAPS